MSWQTKKTKTMNHFRAVEAKYKAVDLKIIFYSRENKTHFHKKGSEISLFLKVRVYGTRKWPVPERIKNSPTCNLAFKVRNAPAVVA